MSKKEKKSSGGLFKLLIIMPIVAVVALVGYFVISKISDSTIKFISIEGAYSELYVGNPEYSSVVYDVGVYPAEAYNKSVKVYSSDTNVAVAEITSSGQLKIDAVGEGTAKITIQSVAKSSLTDSCVVKVMNKEVQGINFVKQTAGEQQIITSVDMQKDGIEHQVYFNIDPIDANMEHIFIDYDESVLESVRLDTVNKCLVVVPKTDVLSTTTEVDLYITRSSDIGMVTPDPVSIRINLKDREGYLKFSFARGQQTYNLEYSYEHNNLVYLDPASSISDFYLKLDLGYTPDFDPTVNDENKGEFVMKDYTMFLNDTMVFNFDEKENDKAEVEGVFNIKKYPEFGCYYISISNVDKFKSVGSFRVRFEHKFSDAVDYNYFEIKYLEKVSLQTSLYLSNGCELKDDHTITSGKPLASIACVNDNQSIYTIHSGSSVVLETSFDNAIDASLIKLYPVIQEAVVVEKDKDGNEVTRESSYNPETGIYTYSTRDDNGNYSYLTLSVNGNVITILDAYSSIIATTNNLYVNIPFRYEKSYWDKAFTAGFPLENDFVYMFSFYVETIYIQGRVNNIELTEKNLSSNVVFYSTLDFSKSNEVNHTFRSYFNDYDMHYGNNTDVIFNVSIDADNSDKGHWFFTITFNTANMETGKSYSDYKGTYLIDFYYGNEQPIHIWVTLA